MYFVKFATVGQKLAIYSHIWHKYSRKKSNRREVNMHFEIPVPEDVRGKGWLDEFKEDTRKAELHPVKWSDDRHGSIIIATGMTLNNVSIEIWEDQILFCLQNTSLASTIRAIIATWFEKAFETARKRNIKVVCSTSVGDEAKWYENLKEAAVDVWAHMPSKNTCVQQAVFIIHDAIGNKVPVQFYSKDGRLLDEPILG